VTVRGSAIRVSYRFVLATARVSCVTSATEAPDGARTKRATAGGDETACRKFFWRDLHAGLVRNMRKAGVLTTRVAPDLEALGISLAAA
jgi:hypothetical protein